MSFSAALPQGRLINVGERCNVVSVQLGRGKGDFSARFAPLRRVSLGLSTREIDPTRSIQQPLWREVSPNRLGIARFSSVGGARRRARTLGLRSVVSAWLCEDRSEGRGDGAWCNYRWPETLPKGLLVNAFQHAVRKGGVRVPPLSKGAAISQIFWIQRWSILILDFYIPGLAGFSQFLLAIYWPY